MSKKFLVFLITIFYISASNAEITNKFILNSKVRGKESISIAVTPLTSNKQIKNCRYVETKL